MRGILLCLLCRPCPVLSLFLRYLLARENRLRETRAAAGSGADKATDEKADEHEDGDSMSAEEREQERVEREDLTDFENTRFRYTL